MAVADREEPQPEFFVRYLREAAKWLSVMDLKHRGAAIERSKAPLQALDGVEMVSALCACLDGPWWQQKASSRGRNWVWRDKVPPHLTESREVVLERRLAQRSSERWTCQMSTSSGLRLGARDSRRSIDIVQFSQENEYRFIELKVGSDQPLYATFEVLGYGLLYLLAGRRQLSCPAGQGNCRQPVGAAAWPAWRWEARCDGRKSHRTRCIGARQLVQIQGITWRPCLAF